jgi:hypothetical protein
MFNINRHLYIFIAMKANYWKQFIRITIPALFISMGVNGQSPVKIGISMGTVYPLGEFKSYDFESNQAGFSLSGFNLNIDGDYFVNNRVALSGRIFLGTTGINEAAYMTKMDTDVKQYLMPNLETTRYDIGSWTWISPMGGIKLNYPIVLNKIWIEGGAYCGINFSPIPNQSMIIADSIQKHLVITENTERMDYSFPVLFDGGFRFKMNDKTQLSLKASYYQTNTKYTHKSYIVQENKTDIIDIKTSAQQIPVKTVNISLGLVYSL